MRYIIRQPNGTYFKHPNDTCNQEWTNDVHCAHQFVTENAARAAIRAFKVVHGIDLYLQTIGGNLR